MNDCVTFHEVVFDPFYRITQLYTLLASLGAIFPLFHLIFFKLRKSTFNNNVKCLFMLYFGLILISVINSAVVFCHHIVIPFVSVAYCDVMVNPFKLRIFEYVGVFGMSSPMLMSLGISAERILAIILARNYEKSRLHIGLAIGVIVTTLDIFIVIMLFHDEKFDQPMMSYFTVPTTSGHGMNVLCYWLLVLNLINLLFNYILVKINRILREKWRSDLSTRYQMEENIITTQFSTYIAFFHVFFFMLYLVFTLLIRIIGPDFLTSPADLLTLRCTYITIPTYNLIIGLLSCTYLKHLQTRKVAKVSAEVAIKHTGVEGAQIYEQVIQNAWEMPEIRNSRWTF